MVAHEESGRMGKVARRESLAGRVGNGRSGGRSRLWIRGRGNSAGAGGSGRAACWDGQRGTASGTVRRAASHHYGGRVREDGTGGVPGYCEDSGADKLASHVGDAG